MNELQKGFDEKGETLDADADEQFETLKDEIDVVDKQLERYRDLEKVNALSAKPVEAKTDKQAAENRGGHTDHPCAARTAERHDLHPLHRRQDRRQDGRRHQRGRLCGVEVLRYPGSRRDLLKAAVAAGTTTDTTWASPLVQLQNATSEFLDLLRPATIIGRIPGLTRVPFNIRIPSMTTDPTAYWVGEGGTKPVSAAAFDTQTLTFAKAVGLTVITEELLRFSTPSAEALLRNGLTSGDRLPDRPHLRRSDGGGNRRVAGVDHQRRDGGGADWHDGRCVPRRLRHADCRPTWRRTTRSAGWSSS